MRRLLIIPLFFLTAVCCLCSAPARIASLFATPTPTVTATSTATLTPTWTPTLTATVTPSPTFTPSPTLSPSPTPIPSDTPTPTTEPTPTYIPLSLDDQRDVFEDLWITVRDNYLYPDFNGADWNAIHDEYNQRLETGLTTADFYLAMGEMINLLQDDHSVFLDPQMVADEEAEYAGNLDYVGIGIIMSAVPERQRAVIILVFPGSPAEEVGLKAHDSILSVDGVPILDEEGFLQNIVRGPEGTTITVSVQTPGEEPRELSITRRRISGQLPVPYSVLTTPSGKRVGYILIINFADGTIDDSIGEALDAMTADGPLDGLILDNRQNVGGYSDVLEGTLSYFTTGLVGNFISRGQTEPLRIRPEDIGGSQDVPLVVMVGTGTASFGEIFSGVMKDIGRAYLIGETTDGNVEILWGYDFSDGSRAWIAHDTFRPLNHPEENWEQTGIIPDLPIAVEWDLVTLETDPAVLAALEHFDTLAR